MPRSIRPWLGTFVESELRAATAWARRSDETNDVKREVEDRFVDDGSNFRSVADIHCLPSQGQVQILTVLSVVHPFTVLVGDGAVTIRARLSRNALASLEAGIGETVDPTTTGDVCTVTHMTVISTPYGVPDTHVQLDIESLVYDFHLRKTAGEPQPLEELPNIQQLINEITQIRNQQYSLEVDAGLPAASASTSVGKGIVKSEGESDTRSRLNLQQTVIEATPRGSLSSQSDPRPESQAEVVTQIDIPRRAGRRAGAVIDDRGFTSGLNWDRPTAPDLNVTQNYLETEFRVPQGSASPRTASTAPEKRKASGTSGQSTAPLVRKTQSAGRPRTEEIADIRSRDATVTPVADALPAQHESVETSDVPRDRDHHRIRKVAPNQQTILDQSSSWRPSLPGRQFPHPNIPVALLEEWNARANDSAVRYADRSAIQAAGSRREMNPSKLKNNHHHTTRDQLDDNEPVDISESVGSDTSSDDALSGMEWEPTPPGKGRFEDQSRRKAELPPDSSNEMPLLPLHQSSNKDTSSSNSTSSGSLPMDIEDPSGCPESESDPDGDMKMHVPRTLESDPFSMHRQRRRDELRSAQRRKWIKANYHQHDSLTSAYHSYQNTYTNDQLDQTEFAHAVQTSRSLAPLSASEQPRVGREATSTPARSATRNETDSQTRVAPHQQAVSSPLSDVDRRGVGEDRRESDPPSDLPHPLQAMDEVKGPGMKSYPEPMKSPESGTFRLTKQGAHLDLRSTGDHSPTKLLPQPQLPASLFLHQSPARSSESEAALPDGIPPRSTTSLVRSETKARQREELEGNKAASQQPPECSKDPSSPIVYPSQVSNRVASSMAVPQSSVLVRPEQRDSAPGVVPATPDQLVKSMPAKTNGNAEAKDGRSPTNGGASRPFGDFAEAVAHLRPGGAFATDSPMQPSRRAILVLDWGF